ANGALDPQLPGPLAALGPCRSCILNKAEPAGFEYLDVPQPKRVGRPPKMDAANAAAHARMNTSVSLPSQDRMMVQTNFSMWDRQGDRGGRAPRLAWIAAP